MGVEDQLLLELAALVQTLEKMRPLCLWQYGETECDDVTKAHRVKFRRFQIRERDLRITLGIDGGDDERQRILLRLR